LSTTTLPTEPAQNAEYWTWTGDPFDEPLPPDGFAPVPGEPGRFQRVETAPELEPLGVTESLDTVAASAEPPAPEQPEAVLRFSRPITGNGMAAIREWVYSVEREFGGQSLATCHYAALVGYSANLKTFRVEASDREVARQAGLHRSRLKGHAQRLVAAGYLMEVPKKYRETGTRYVLSEPVDLLP
jgi:hypothetical protein